jgi:hypothetical protein
MNSLWIAFEKLTGQIVKISPTEIDNDRDTRQAIRVPDSILTDLTESNSLSRLFFDFKAAVVDNRLVLHDKQETIIDPQFNKMVSINYVHRSQQVSTDLKLEITSLENKPVLKITFSGNQSLRSNKFKNKELIHLTAKNDINTHYQTFEIDLTKFDNEIVFDIDRCDYRLLFSNQISFYHRKKLNIVYTIT